MKKIDLLIFQEYKFGIQHLALFRIFFCLFALIIGIPNFEYLGDLPQIFYKPPFFSLQNLLSDFPPKLFFTVTSSFIFFLYFIILFGYKTKISSILLTILLVINHGFSFSLGKIDHTNMITVWIPLFLGIAGWGKALSIDAHISENKIKTSLGWPIFMLSLLLAFGMFSAGLLKLNNGWLSFEDQAVKFHFIKSYAYMSRNHLLAETFYHLNISNFFWEILDYITVIFEIGFLFTIIKKQWFKNYILIAMFFHLFNILIFNISFLENFPIYVLFIPYNRICNFEKAQTFIESIFKLKFLIPVSIIFFILYRLNIVTGINQLAVKLGVNTLYFHLVMMLLLIMTYSLPFLHKNKMGSNNKTEQKT